jgi:hypothetical protein
MVNSSQESASAGVDGAIAYRVRVGRLHRVHHGVYAVGHQVLTRRGRWMAAVLAAGPRAVLSHAAAGGAVGPAPQRGPDRRRHGPRHGLAQPQGAPDPPRPRPHRPDHHVRRDPVHHAGQDDPRPGRDAPEKTARARPRPGGEPAAHGRPLPRCPGPGPRGPPRSEQAVGDARRSRARHDPHEIAARGAVPRALPRRRPPQAQGQRAGQRARGGLHVPSSTVSSSRPTAGATTAAETPSSATAAATPSTRGPATAPCASPTTSSRPSRRRPPPRFAPR